MGLGLKTMDNIHHILIFAYYLRISSKSILSIQSIDSLDLLD